MEGSAHVSTLDHRTLTSRAARALAGLSLLVGAIALAIGVLGALAGGDKWWAILAAGLAGAARAGAAAVACFAIAQILDDLRALRIAARRPAPWPERPPADATDR